MLEVGHADRWHEMTCLSEGEALIATETLCGGEVDPISGEAVAITWV
jgi:hypothetical protein